MSLISNNCKKEIGRNFFVHFYNDSNLGDDLFLEMLVQRFPSLQFYIYEDDDKPTLNKTFHQYNNLHFAKTNLSNKTIEI